MKEKAHTISHSFIKLLRIEMLEGIGPSKPVAWISLLINSTIQMDLDHT